MPAAGDIVRPHQDRKSLWPQQKTQFSVPSTLQRAPRLLWASVPSSVKTGWIQVSLQGMLGGPGPVPVAGLCDLQGATDLRNLRGCQHRPWVGSWGMPWRTRGWALGRKEKETLRR